jgi:glycosyltransferase involved in cell wall biosynthesis/thymidylate kinase
MPLNLLRKLRRLVQPTGLFVVILGPDGAGKSTVTSLVLSRLTGTFRKTWRFHWRPGLLPKLSRSGRGAEVAAAGEAPPEQSKYRGVVSLLRFLYYWLDFVAGYWLIVYPRKAQTTLVVGERYFPDVLVNPQRYGFTAPRWLMRVAAACVPSPDLLILLTGDPDVIHARKAELSLTAIAAQLAAYRSEIRHWGPAVAVTTADDADAVAMRVSNLILDTCTRRAAHRLRIYGSAEKWRGFPTRRRAKIWIGDKDSLANALNLYHPYSRWGSIAKSFAVSLALRLPFGWPGGVPDPHTAAELDRFARIIRAKLGNRDAAVSFSTGTPGAHRKLVAQVSTGGRILSYVKIGSAPVHSALLQREAEMLEWLRETGLDSASFPQVIATEESEGHRLLFLTAPASPGRQWPLEPEDRDARFLADLASRSSAKVSVNEFSDKIGFTAFHAAMARSDASAADALQMAMVVIDDLLSGSGVRLAPCHGDFAPWNSLELQDGTLYVFDWEYGSRAAPALTDLFHRVLMPARLVLRQPAPAVVDRMLRLWDDPILGRVVRQSGVERSELTAYLLLYLIGMMAREHRSNDQVSAFLVAAIDHAIASTRSFEGHRKVLVAAYACEPARGSEPGVGWNMCQAISRDNEAWVVTRKNNRDAIEQALARKSNPHLHFVYVDLPYWARFWKRGARGIHLYYYLWQFAAWREARRLMRTVKFDLAHHVTFVTSYQFTFLALLPVPFVWGPIGHNPKPPQTFVWSLRWGPKGWSRFLVQQLLRLADPLFWLSVVRARVILGISAEVGKRAPISWLGRSKFICHTAIGVEDNAPIAARSQGLSGIRILSMGHLIGIKGFDLSVRAFAQLSKHDPTATLVIVGSGPDEARLKRLVVELGIQKAVQLVPWLPRDQAMAMMNDADVFLFPSFEGGGMVVLEAMAHGLPVVCLDFGGPGEMVTADCGIVVKVGDFKDTIQRLADALSALAQNSALRQTMSAAGRRRIEANYLWRTRHEAIARWYTTALGGSPGKRAA